MNILLHAISMPSENIFANLSIIHLSERIYDHNVLNLLKINISG